MQTPRTDFALALKAITNERGLEAETILEAIKQAIIAAYRRDARERGEEEDEEISYEAEIDPVSGEAKIFSYPEGKPEKKEDITPPGFGRIAAQTAKQVIHQKIREAEKGALMDEYSSRVDSLISGVILRFDGADVKVDLGRAEGVMPAKERVPNERLNSGQRMTFLLKEIADTKRGKQVILSRADPKFVQKLFEREVPEMASGSVEVKAIARDPGVRTKMAVSSSQSGVDPVGSCVGQKGVRVKAVTNELGGEERIDILTYTEDVAELIEAALAPAEDLSVHLDENEKVALVKAPEDKLSLAIGKDGQNAKLASQIVGGWKIKVEPIEDASDKSSENKQEKEGSEDMETKENELDEKSEEGKGKEAEEKDEKKEDTKKNDKKEPDSMKDLPKNQDEKSSEDDDKSEDKG